MTPRKIELLAPAANAEVAIEAILHGADAVYIGPPSHGARKNASNSIADLKRVVEFAHQFGARVYATVNTIVYDHELRDVERLIRELYIIGVDALIVQDMGILRLDIPPIELHASTQCDTRTVEKAGFLEAAGFSQIVLARELTLKEIGEICRSVSVPVETFVHGALCVSYSGRCHASQAVMGRSANRGECAQICRLPFTLTDAGGKVLATDRHLLSLKDFNASDRLESLLEAGVSS
ncbi:MAG: U32 family peptidase, partial [Muribaculaceae bacterium]|nr:U32 family peptidase [Muribaculaceae bacterium]